MGRLVERYELVGKIVAIGRTFAGRPKGGLHLIINIARVPLCFCGEALSYLRELTLQDHR